ncbi:MAG: 50S ribosomal protein L28 [Deltaproteobacteria bacterium RIFCSPLOWO2_12_FULL_40_28]|nr:MAG: 50S ribosomal protein L28 [Deltaproteobacteria bacterium RIFCSPHIGHO2_02_FULL_40_28]OGQ20493.1 MAG: 50S ribosomal protein L28 [Deltaproteobacteria bacterium RIFCSPHIGHO2_12_FULL_40_32]OGQ41123.1 MAG: 50S ribosomal protein L28 [Deltaproteobacteria bacterium RIFCSPLOWO2_02_FULL_40_36]OGQ55103.1 MAG: 50S ribosomal protein L28 [Deltaproteobacteria bacterium RIFCSPLOWO2_12_FULL_40_28]
MAYACELTGKRKLKGHRVSHANNKTIHYQMPNIQVRTFFLPELKSRVRVKVSTSALRTVTKLGGLSLFLVKANPTQLSVRLQKIRSTLLQKGFKN